MKLSSLSKITGKRKKRVGRGYGSGKGGHTVGRGTKGQKARGKVRLGFEGGQLPLVRRVPKRGGFRSLRERPAMLNLSDLVAFRDGEKVNPDSLLAKGLIERIPSAGIKILSKGKGRALKFEGVGLSAKARDKVEKAGGKIAE